MSKEQHPSEWQNKTKQNLVPMVHVTNFIKEVILDNLEISLKEDDFGNGTRKLARIGC